MGLPPYGPEPYASANSATPAKRFLCEKQYLSLMQTMPSRNIFFSPRKIATKSDFGTGIGTGVAGLGLGLTGASCKFLQIAVLEIATCFNLL